MLFVGLLLHPLDYGLFMCVYVGHKSRLAWWGRQGYPHRVSYFSRCTISFTELFTLIPKPGISSSKSDGLEAGEKDSAMYFTFRRGESTTNRFKLSVFDQPVNRLPPCCFFVPRGMSMWRSNIYVCDRSLVRLVARLHVHSSSWPKKYEVRILRLIVSARFFV